MEAIPKYYIMEKIGPGGDGPSSLSVEFNPEESTWMISRGPAPTAACPRPASSGWITISACFSFLSSQSSGESASSSATAAVEFLMKRVDLKQVPSRKGLIEPARSAVRRLKGTLLFVPIAGKGFRERRSNPFMIDYSSLDRSPALRYIFYPRRDFTLCPVNAFDLSVPVEDDVSVLCRFYAGHQQWP